jgi:hypothetical protein
MAEKYRVSGVERHRRIVIADRSLNLSGSFLWDQMRSGRKIGLGQLVGPEGA